MDQSNLDDKKPVEFRLTFKQEDSIEVLYFDTVVDAYDYISEHKILTFNLVKERLIASRFYSGK